jgi:hypothetical protein
MKRHILLLLSSVGLLSLGGDASGRGFGGFGGGRSFSGGFSHEGGFSSYSGGTRYGGSYSGSRSFESSSGWGGRQASGSYDHTWSSASGASLSTSGSRGAYEGRYGGVAAGGTRETTLTTASGHTYSASHSGAVASGPGGRTVGGASGSVEGRYGAGNWESAFSGNRYAGDMSHYASAYGANGFHSTAYWSSGFMGTRAGYVRSGFGYYGCFRPAWYTLHPGCWFAAGWVAGAAWSYPTYAVFADYCGMNAAAAPDYDYGSTVVFQNDNVYVNGQDGGTAQNYAEIATALATQGQAASPAPNEDWKPLGVFALVQGDEKTSNNIFQLAVNKDGVIRGNYYEGLTDTTTEVYGQVDKKTQQAAWTIGKKQDRVFEAGAWNLTQPQCPCLLHLGTQKTQQLLLVRIDQPKNGSPAPK